MRMYIIDKLNCENPHIQETQKSSDILDKFGNLRFKVILLDYPENINVSDISKNNVPFIQNYYVYVKSFWRCEQPNIVVSRNFSIYDHAIRFYHDMIKQYAYLVQAETHDVQDINIYAGRTGYHKICPNCCATCKWASPCDKNNCLFDDWRLDLHGKFLCMNSKLYSNSRNDIQPDCRQHDEYHDYSAERKHVADIHPVVEANGLCNGFERKLDNKYKDPSHSEYRFRHQDMTHENMFETISKYEVKHQFDAQKSDILQEVGEAIEDQLKQNAPIIDGNRENEMIFNGGSI